jgi:hypothetical protein
MTTQRTRDIEFPVLSVKESGPYFLKGLRNLPMLDNGVWYDRAVGADTVVDVKNLSQTDCAIECSFTSESRCIRAAYSCAWK